MAMPHSVTLTLIIPGNDEDKKDIVFTFDEDLSAASSITFEIEGSTAWRTVTTDEAGRDRVLPVYD